MASRQGSLVAWTWSCMRPYRGRILLIALIALVEIGLGVLTPWTLGIVIDNVLGTQPMPPAVAGIADLLAGGSKAQLLMVVAAGEA